MGESHLAKASLGKIYKDLLFTKAKLLSDPKVADLSSQLQPSLDSIKAAQAAENAAGDLHVVAEAKVASVQSRCEEEFGATYIGVETVTGKLHDNSTPLGKLMFPAGLTAAKDLSGAQMQLEVRRMHAAIKDEGIAEGLTAHLRPLAEIDKAFDKPLAELQQATAAVAVAQRKSDLVRESCLDARAVLESLLGQRFPRQKRYVSSFFPKAKKAKSSTAAKKKAASEKNGAADQKPGTEQGAKPV